jgi:hypothetical protein
MMGRRVGRPGLPGTIARTAVVAGTAQAVGGRVARHQNAEFRVQAEQGALIAQLERLGAPHSQGLLTDAEFAAATSALLS